MSELQPSANTSIDQFLRPSISVLSLTPTTRILRYSSEQQPPRSLSCSQSRVCIAPPHCNHAIVTPQMASNNTPPTCSVCANPAAKHCAGCVSEELTKLLGHRMPTLYCSKTCQEDDWKSHKKLCHLAQAQTKLFRTGETLQEIFLATRAEAFDLLLARVECSGDDIVHIYQATETPLPRIRPLSVNLPADRKVKHAVLSYRAGTDALSGMMFQLGQELLKGTLNSGKQSSHPANIVQIQATRPKSRRSMSASSPRK